MHRENITSNQTAHARALALAQALRQDGRIGASAPLVRWAQDAAAGRLDTVPLASPLLGSLTKALRKGAVTIISGPKAVSKSFFILQNAATWHGHDVPFACRFLEDSQDVYLARLLSQSDGSDWTDPDAVKADPGPWHAAYARHRDFLDGISDAIEAENKGIPTYGDLLGWVADRVDLGCRVVVIDPISIADSGPRPWEADRWFMGELKRIIDGKASAVLVTHPRRDGTGMAGGEAFSRLSHCIIDIAANREGKQVWVKGGYGVPEICLPDRIVTIDKARFAPGTGMKIAMRFCPKRLQFFDIGAIVPKPKGAPAEAPVDHDFRGEDETPFNRAAGEPWTVARHEAGHCVMAVLCRMPIRQAVAGAGGGHVLLSRVPEYLQRLRVGLAGVVAEFVMSGAQLPENVREALSTDDDLEQVVRGLHGVEADAAARPARLALEVGVVERLLQSNRAAVEAVAAALLERGTLGGGEVLEVVLMAGCEGYPKRTRPATSKPSSPHRPHPLEWPSPAASQPKASKAATDTATGRRDTERAISPGKACNVFARGRGSFSGGRGSCGSFTGADRTNSTSEFGLIRAYKAAPKSLVGPAHTGDFQRIRANKDGPSKTDKGGAPTRP